MEFFSGGNKCHEYEAMILDDRERSSQNIAAALSLPIHSVSGRFQSMSTSERRGDQIFNFGEHGNGAVSSARCAEVHSEMSANENDHRRFRIGDEDAVFRSMEESHSSDFSERFSFLADRWFSFGQRKSTI